MSIVASAPGRVNLIGEHTDYNGGRCLPFAIDLRATVSLRPRPSPRLTARSEQVGEAVTVELDQLRPGIRGGWAAYPFGVIWALQQQGWAVPGMELAIDSDVPLGAGLSSSAALEGAVATAVAAHLGHDLDDAQRRRLTAACVRAETEFVGAPTGGMDQAVAFAGRAGHALLCDFGADTRELVPLDLRAAGLTVLVVDTGHAHDLVAPRGGYAVRRQQCEAAAQEIGVDALCRAEVADLRRIQDLMLRARARHVITEDARVEEALTAIDAADWKALGRVLSASHQSLRDDFAVSTEALDLAAATATEAGALGARLVGGGFGGSAIALTARGRVDDVRDAIDAAFEGAGHPPPTYYEVDPAAGAAVT